MTSLPIPPAQAPIFPPDDQSELYQRGLTKLRIPYQIGFPSLLQDAQQRQGQSILEAVPRSNVMPLGPPSQGAGPPMGGPSPDDPAHQALYKHAMDILKMYHAIGFPNLLQDAQQRQGQSILEAVPRSGGQP